jgi:hypothetical protein
MMNRSAMNIAITAVALAVTCASTADAQNADTKTLAKPKVNAVSCADIQWQKEIVARYPNIAAGCQEVVVSNDTRFARFAGELERVNGDGSVTIDFKDRNGHSLGRSTKLQPAPTQRVLIQGQRYRFSELAPGQHLNMYIPEAVLGVTMEPVLAPASIATMVFDDAAAPAEASPEPTRLAQASPEPATAEPRRLPDTAGWSPLLALAGVLALGGGIALTARRRFRKSELV